MSISGLDGHITRVVTTGNRFINDSQADSTAFFEDALITLLRALPSLEPTSRLQLSSHIVVDMLSVFPAVLSSSSTSPTTRSKVHRLLFNIAYFNVRIRRYLSGELEMCGPVYQCLKTSLNEELGPQNLIDILRLLQLLTYEKCVVLGMWANGLVSFLLEEITRVQEVEWMPYCVTILCNLASRSKTVCAKIKNSKNHKAFCKRMIDLLSHDSRVVVISALVLVGFLDEKVRDLVYCRQNFRETVLCVFNVLAMGDKDCLMTRHIACDLLRRLIVSDAPSISSIPVITSMAKDLTTYNFFPSSIQRCADLFVHLDARLDESIKIYDVFLSLCSLQRIKSNVCQAVISCAPSESRLTTPLHAIATTASLSDDEAIDPIIPIKAMKLLTYLCKEMINSNMRISSHLPVDKLIAIIETSIKTPIETGKEASTFQCQQIVEGIRLAEGCAHDEEIRNRLLSLISVPLFGHISEFQLLTNPVVIQMTKAPKARTDVLPDWSISGVSIVLELIQLLAVFKDHSKPHKTHYWNFLKDERLLAFLAYAIAYGDHSTVHNFLVTYTHCVQVENFPTQWLSDLITSCLITKEMKLEAIKTNTSFHCAEDIKRNSPELMDCSGLMSSSSVGTSHYLLEIDDLLQRIRSGLEIRDVKTVDILSAYDKKISLLQARERELERVVASSEKLRTHLKSNHETNEVDMARIRLLVSDTEQMKAENERLANEAAQTKKSNEDAVHQLKSEMAVVKRSAEEEIAHLKNELATSRRNNEQQSATMKEEISRINQDRENLKTEIDQERSLVVHARRHADEQKKRLEVASNALIERGRDVDGLTKKVGELSSDLALLGEKYDRDMGRITAENNSLKDELGSLRCKGQKTQADLEKMRKLREEMLRLAGGYE